MNQCPVCKTALTNGDGICSLCNHFEPGGRASHCPTCGSPMLIQNGINECPSCKEQFLCNGDTLYLY